MDTSLLFGAWSNLDKEIEKVSNQLVFTYQGFYRCSFGFTYIAMNKMGEQQFFIEIPKFEYPQSKFEEYENVSFSFVENSKLEKEKVYLKISLVNNVGTNEVFRSFCVSCILMIAKETRYNDVYDDLLIVLDRYSTFLSKKKKHQLSKIEKQGLFGELVFLKGLLKANGEKAIECWSGPDRNRHDFVLQNNTGIEIKTIESETRKIISISNENQLSSVSREKLFLTLFVLEENSAGSTFISVAQEIMNDTIHSIDYKKIFEQKLMLYGVKIDDYESKFKFQIFSTNYYAVNELFPIITKDELDEHIYNVQYRIELADVPQLEGDLYEFLG